MEEGEEAWKKDQQGRYARIADYKCTLEIVRLQKEKELEINAMREKNDPRMTERGSREEEYNASLDQTRQLLHSVRQQQAYLQDLNVVVEGEMGCRCTRRACLLEKRLKQDLPLLGLPLLHRLAQCLSLTASSTSIAAGTRAVPASIAWTGSAGTATPL